MSIPHNLVTERWAEGNPNNLSMRGNNVFANGGRIYSYGMHFCMAIRDEERKLFIINGDRYSHSTDRHQRNVRSEINSKSDWDQINIPFSVIRAAGISDPTKINLIETGQEINEAGCRTCNIPLSPHYVDSADTYWNHKADHKDHDVWTRHLLAPSLISAPISHSEKIEPEVCSYGCGKDRAEHTDAYDPQKGYMHSFMPERRIIDEKAWFLSGFDETGKGFGGGYFFSRLPHEVSTIEEAFASLKPAEVGEDFKRQGDIFAVPDPITTRQLNKIGKRLPRHELKEVKDWNNQPFGYEETDRLVAGTYAFFNNGNRPQLLNTNHYATEAYQVGDVLYARGVLTHKPSFREADHIRIKLGKVWHRIFKNTAVTSWGVSAKVD